MQSLPALAIVITDNTTHKQEFQFSSNSQEGKLSYIFGRMHAFMHNFASIQTHAQKNSISYLCPCSSCCHAVNTSLHANFKVSCKLSFSVVIFFPFCISSSQTFTYSAQRTIRLVYQTYLLICTPPVPLSQDK